MKYTKEYCINMHRKLWNTVYELIKEETEDLIDSEKEGYLDDICEHFIYDMKVEALNRMYDEGYELPDPEDMETKYQYCFACLYAFSKENVGAAENRKECGEYCKNCPVKWEKSDQETFQCCDAQFGDLEQLNFGSIEYLLELVKEIAELPVQEDV